MVPVKFLFKPALYSNSKICLITLLNGNPFWLIVKAVWHMTLTSIYSLSQQLVMALPADLSCGVFTKLMIRATTINGRILNGFSAHQACRHFGSGPWTTATTLIFFHPDSLLPGFENPAFWMLRRKLGTLAQLLPAPSHPPEIKKGADYFTGAGLRCVWADGRSHVFWSCNVGKPQWGQIYRKSIFMQTLGEVIPIKLSGTSSLHLSARHFGWSE